MTRDEDMSAPEVLDEGLTLSDDSATIQYRVRLVPTRRGDLRVVTTSEGGQIVAVVKIPARRR